MHIDEAREIARLLRIIPNVTVLGVKSHEDGKALIISINRRGQIRITNPDGAVGKVARHAGIKGHFWERLNVCSLCLRTLRSNDGHYHSVINGQGAAEGVCCRCVRKSGAKCSLRERAKKRIA